MSIKKFAALLLTVVLAVFMAAGCSKNQEEEYVQIIDTDSMFSYAMSRAGGLFLVPVIDDFEKLSFSCDNGELFSYSSPLLKGVKELELGADDIEIYEDTVITLVYWMPEPITEDGELPMTEATITIRAELDDGRNVYQVVNVVVDGINFTLVDSKEGE